MTDDGEPFEVLSEPVAEGNDIERQRLARLGYTPEQWREMLANIPEMPADAPLPAADSPGLVRFHADGSVWRNDEHGVPHQTKLPYAERADAEVRNIRERQEEQ